MAMSSASRPSPAAVTVDAQTAPRPLIQLDAPGSRWVKVIDQTRCIGCHACTTACKSENEVPLGVTRTYVKAVDVGVFPQARRAFQVTRCNQCSDAPCVAACPTAAMFQRPDGIVDFDKSACIGCKACIAACPYDAIFINPEDHSAEKCNFCAHRLDVGLEPACVVVCPTQAILVGDVQDASSRVAAIVQREPVSVRRPEKETRPNLFYKGAHQATLDPLAARRPGGGTFMWSELVDGGQLVNSGHPGDRPSHGWNSSAAAVLAYDVPHHAPWDWRVSLYTWTKGIAAGGYLVPLLLLLTGVVSASSPIWMWSAPMVGGAFLALTGLLLIADLEHPTRFVKLFQRPQWRSWLVRGAVFITGFTIVLVLHFASNAAELLGAGSAPGMAGAPEALAWVGAPFALATAIYTAYLFAQAKARDLWQSSLLPAHLAVQAALAGSAVTMLVAAVVEPGAVPTLAVWLAASTAAHLALVWGEVTLAHPTAHAHLAVHEMTRGRHAGFFWFGLVLVAASLAAPFAGSVFAPALAAAALVGLLAHEHAYVQAGQSVPLA
ncbi:MAG TPA: 4Fe-4S dicluster domain-containing protein [Candidatus Limnocylindrales bacterium]|nr:4Fe-4S dicluster domain-containing protein [Candidatus Limnocylindrales bacterium]